MMRLIRSIARLKFVCPELNLKHLYIYLNDHASLEQKVELYDVPLSVVTPYIVECDLAT